MCPKKTLVQYTKKHYYSLAHFQKVKESSHSLREGQAGQLSLFIT